MMPNANTVKRDRAPPENRLTYPESHRPDSGRAWRVDQGQFLAQEYARQSGRRPAQAIRIFPASTGRHILGRIPLFLPDLDGSPKNSPATNQKLNRPPLLLRCARLLSFSNLSGLLYALTHPSRSSWLDALIR